MPNYPYDPLEKCSINALGIQTNYYTMGRRNDQPIIMLHGMSTSADSFRETMHELADDFWLIAPDIPGFGHSENTEPYTIHHLVEWLAAFKERLNLPSIGLVGHSFGGFLSTAFALAYPEDVARLLLSAPALLNGEGYPELLKKVGVSLGLVDLGTAVTQSPAWVKRQIKIPFFDANLQDKSVWERRLKDYELARASASVLKAVAFHSIQSQLHTLSHPIQMVWGANDYVVPSSGAETLLRLFPNAQAELYPECGHVLPLERQAEFQAAIRRFFSNCP